jgi:hypothetical protein
LVCHCLYNPYHTGVILTMLLRQVKADFADFGIPKSKFENESGFIEPNGNTSV